MAAVRLARVFARVSPYERTVTHESVAIQLDEDRCECRDALARDRIHDQLDMTDPFTGVGAQDLRYLGRRSLQGWRRSGSAPA